MAGDTQESGLSHDYAAPRFSLALVVIALASFFLWRHLIDGATWKDAVLIASTIFSAHALADDKLTDR
jgi:hypothetical protein